MVTMTIYYWEVQRGVKATKSPSVITSDHTRACKINKSGKCTDLLIRCLSKGLMPGTGKK